MKIKAAIVREKGHPFVIEEIDLDEPRADEVLVRMVGSGLCHTDLVARDQYLPVPLPGVFGHEGAGVVEKVGSAVKKVQPGDHVVMSYLSDGTCPSCKKGVPTHCSTFFPGNFSGARLDGSTTMRKGSEIIHGSFFSQSSFASHSLANERNVVKVDADLPLEMLGPLGCGIQTGAGGVINSLKARPGTSIAVFGAGSVGVSAIMAAVVSGCTTIIAVDVNDGRLEDGQELRRDPHGQFHNDRSGSENSGDHGPGCRLRTGMHRHSEGAAPGGRCLAMGGACGLIGAAPAGSEVSLDMQTILNGRTVLG